MTVYVAWSDYEAIAGVYQTLAEAVHVLAGKGEGIDEFVLGQRTRVRSYTFEGLLWWENGHRI